MYLLFNKKYLFLFLFFTSTLVPAQKKFDQLNDLYLNSEWHTVIGRLSGKENISAAERELLVKSYADSASFLDNNGMEGSDKLYQLAYQNGVVKNNNHELTKAIGYFCNNEYETSKSILSDLLKTDPDNWETHYWYWSADIASGDTNLFKHPNLLKGLELNPTSSDLLLNIGILHYNNKSYNSSIFYLEQSISSRDDFYQRYYLGCVYSQLENWEKAKENLLICIDQRSDFAIAYYVLGSIEIYNGNVKDAVSLFKKILKIAPNYYSYIENLKQYYPVLKDYNFIKKVTIRPSVDLLNKGIQQSNSGEYAKSIKQIRKAISELQQESPLDTTMIFSAYNWQMVNYTQTKNYEKSNERALQLLKFPSKNEFHDTEQASIYAYLATNYQRMGDNLSALKYAIESYQRIKEIESAKNYLLPSVLNIAFLSYDSEEYDFCKSYLEEAKTIQAKQLFNLEDAMTLLEIEVKLKISLKKYDSALEEISVAEKGFDFSTGPNLEHNLDELRFKVFVQNKKMGKATSTLKKLEKEAHSNGVRKFYYSELIAEDLTEYWIRLGENNEAFYVLKEKIQSINGEIFLNFPFMNEEGKSLNYSKNNKWLAKYFSYLYLNKNKELGRNKIIFGANTSNFFKNSISNNNNKIFHFANDQQDQIGLAYLDTLKTIKQRIRNEDIVNQEKENLIIEEKNITDFISNRYGILMKKEFLGCNQIINKIPGNDVVVNIAKFNYYDFENSKFISDSILYAFIVLGKNRETEIRFINNGKALEGKWINGYRNFIKFQKTDNYSYKKFFGPIDDLLDKDDNIWIIPDGVYHFINPNTLYVPEKGKYLIETNKIHLVNKFEDSTFVQSIPEFTSATVIGNPNFNETEKEIYQALQGINIDYEGHSGHIHSEGINRTRSGEDVFAALPGTHKELESISRTLKLNNVGVTSFEGNLAIESLVKNKLDGSIIHFATHGVFEESTNNLNNALNAKLILSGANNIIDNLNNNGILTSKEIEELVLNKTELLVLSACETGQGEVKDGQGVFGLQRAFVNAGVNQLIMSLWKVDDEATNLLMSYFYANLFKKETVHEAFSNAQLQLKTEYPQPYYWGAFILVK